MKAPGARSTAEHVANGCCPERQFPDGGIVSKGDTYFCSGASPPIIMEAVHSHRDEGKHQLIDQVEEQVAHRQQSKKEMANDAVERVRHWTCELWMRNVSNAAESKPPPRYAREPHVSEGKRL